MSLFDPSKPYRLTTVRRSSQYGCYGWATDIFMFSTLNEAEEAYNKPMAANVYKHILDKLELQPNTTRLKIVAMKQRKR